jgi:ATP-dependent DNA helicase RecG
MTKEITRSYQSPISLHEPVRYLKGVGPRLAEKLLTKGIATIEDLLFSLPYRYEDRRELKPISKIRAGEKAVVSGKIVACGKTGRRWRPGFQAVIDDGSGALALNWFRMPGGYLEDKLKKGRVVIASQTVRKYGPLLEMDHPELEIFEESEQPDSLSFGRIVPIYSLPEGFSQKSFRALVFQALEKARNQFAEIIPPEILAKKAWPDFQTAICNAHFPAFDADIDELNQLRSPWHQRLYYQEFFLLELALALNRKGMTRERAFPVRAGERKSQQLKKIIPFQLTGSQEKVIAEIAVDLAKSQPMHRLLQGDVGSGKTMVALFAALAVIDAGLQVAVMAPSEVLAEQHWLNLHRWLDQLGIACGLLTAGVRGEEREKILLGVREGTISLLVGTQALIQEKVAFKRLGLAVIDEQHRFGVEDRLKLKAKAGERPPHVLVMTATPIPRSLAMTAYGDLDISLLDEMPPGRKPPATILLSEGELDRAWTEIKNRACRGEQAYVIYPLVEESAKLEIQNATRQYAELSRKTFPELKVGLIHGRLSPEAKEEVMDKFRRGEIQILVATTVIEVGVDVPNATVMVVEHAERFGLSQLHQLRGRVVRSEKDAVCFLVAHEPLTELARERLKTIATTTDGFRIAEADLRLRGPGELLGTRQSGLPPFRFADLVRDLKELALARNDAFQWAETHDLERPEYAALKKALLKRYGGVLHLAGAG